MQKDAKIYVAGHRGLVGSAILQELQKQNYTNLITKTHKELDLTNQAAVNEFFQATKPEYVILSAAKAGGILANSTLRADFLYENLMINANVMHSAYEHKVKKLLFIASTAIYPKNAKLPTKENELLNGDLHYANKPYAIAKISGILLAESYNLQYGTNFIAIVPINLYGNEDKFDLQTAYVMPALVRKFHLAKLLENDNFDAVLKDLNTDEKTAKQILQNFGISAKSVEIWGDGTPYREFLHSSDLAKACMFIMQKLDWQDLCDTSEQIQNTHLNVGVNSNITIKELANLVRDIVGFKGQIKFNPKYPNGAIFKLTDCTKIQSLGWKHEINLEQGIKMMYEWYLNNHEISLGGGYELKSNLVQINFVSKNTRLKYSKSNNISSNSANKRANLSQIHLKFSQKSHYKILNNTCLHFVNARDYGCLSSKNIFTKVA